jgi:5-methyltetrahydropteroyltriglutamate--homocysteine methyltransferase
MADDFGYHIDHHGSLVRPEVLARGTDTAALDAAARTVAHTLRRLTLSAVSDGQFRRSFFESVVYDQVSGFGPAAGPAPLADAAGIPVARRRAITGSPAVTAPGGRLAQAEAAPVLSTVDRPVFVTLPSPGYLAALGSPLAAAADLDAVRAHGAALAAILRDEIAALAADGVAYVALENPLYTPLLTVEGRAALSAAGVDADAVLGALTETDRAVFAGLSVPQDFRVGLALTDSGPLPATAQGYDKSAAQTLLDETPFQRLLVDYPAAPEARFPAELVKPGIVLSLGVIDVSRAARENVDDVLTLVDPIADERGDRDIAVSTNGGFAQAADAPLLTEEEQNAKLRLVEMAARYYWGNEI